MRNTLTPQKQLFLSGLLFVIFIAAAIILAYFYLTRHAEAEAYRNAPPCSAQATDTENCRRETSAVVERLFTGAGGRRPRLLVQFQLPDGATIQAQIPYQEFWTQLRQGDHVSVELWRKQVMNVKSAGRSEPTSENPGWNSQNILTGGLVVVGTLGAMAVLMFVLGFTRRKKTA